MTKRDEIKESLLVNEVIKALTLEERNLVIEKELRPEVLDAKSKYAGISSRAKASKVEERCNIEGLREEDFYMAFYDCSNESINKMLYGYVEKQDWFNYFVDALVEFEDIEENVNEIFESKYSIYYACCFLMLYGQKKLEEYIVGLRNITVSRHIMNKMISQMAGNLLQVYSKTVIYEYHMNKDGYIDKKNENKLNQYIKDNFSTASGIVNFYIKYPVLIRRLAKKAINMVDYYKELLCNIDREYFKMIEKKMICDNVITDISCDIGDTHEKGKFVVKVYFGDNQIIYKPRNLYISKAYNDFILWINKRFDLHKLPTIKLILQDEYTIEECVKYESCTSKRQLERYYERIGYYIGILYILNGNDIHYENIIAGGEYPYIIDLETLFAHNGEQLLFDHTAAEKIGRYLSQSVKGSCLLPSYMFGDGKQRGVDVSGISGKKAKLPGERPVLSDMNSNNVRFELQKTYLQDNNNIPMLDDKRVDYEPYKYHIIAGFDTFVNLVLNNKDEFIRELDRFYNVKVRQVIRATNNYGQILQYASHPSYTHNMIYLERMLESVFNYPYVNKAVCTCELRELINDDIPIFYCNPGQIAIVSGDGKVIDNFYERSSMDIVTDRIRNLCEEEIYTQSLLVKEALGLGDMENEEEVKKQFDSYRYKELTDTTLSVELINTVIEKIYNILNNKAVRGNDDVNYFARVNDGFDNKAVSFMPIGLNDGMAGILRYLHMCYEMNDEKKYFDLMKEVVSGIKNLQPIESKNCKVNGHTGIFSVLYPVYLYKDITLDCDAIAMFDSIYAFLISTIEEMKYTDVDYRGIGYLIEVAKKLYDRTGDFKYYKVIKELINKVSEFGQYNMLNNVENKDIYGLYYGLNLAKDIIKDDEISNWQKALKDKCVANPDNVDYKEALYKVRLYKECGEEWLYDSIQKDIKASASLEVVDVQQMLYRVDFFCQCMETFREDEKHFRDMYQCEMIRLIKMYSLDDVDTRYNSLIHGLSLNSPICGLGLRLLRYRRENEKDICVYGNQERQCV